MTSRSRAGHGPDAGGSADSAPLGFLVALGAPAAGLALGVTVISTYLPVLVEQTTNAVVIGALVGGEGFFGIFMPTLLGAFSDRTARRVRDRVVLLVGCAVVLALALLAVGVVAELSPHVLVWYVVALVFVYAAYYGYLAPYWALYPDLVPRDRSGRSRSAESTWRVTGVGLALVGGGLLLDVAAGLPFFVAAAAVVCATVVLLVGLRSRMDRAVVIDADRGRLSGTRRLMGDPAIRRLCLAEGLWNFALSSLRAFVVLFFVVGMHRSSSFVSTVIFPLVAVGIAIAAPTAGWIADRWGHLRLLLTALVVYAAGMALPGIWQETWVIAAIPLVAMGAATVMTLPFSVLMRLLPEGNHGAASGLFGLCRGLGATLGPVLTGAVIVLVRPVMDGTEGYAAMWLCCSAILFLSVPLLWGLRHDDRIH
ncbi:MFS transporter [Nocardioides sp. YIM 152315]|uniref:MFS transporter n=1 Tax=Nocardioides sp. YIM 152315 TaxID=3031760 RepID=UPI0023DAFF4E|nr:MFS transporter [Nocardioides sp. YIM 152315]MDF1605930.1 MFS transporter [Nocardioides sp. YIM 152315]